MGFPCTLVVDAELVPPLAQAGNGFPRTLGTVGIDPGITGRRRIPHLLKDLAVMNIDRRHIPIGSQLGRAVSLYMALVARVIISQ